MLLSLSAMPGGKAEETGWKTACPAETAGTALLAAQAPSLLPSFHPVEISWEQVLFCPGANPWSHCPMSSAATLAAAPPAERALLHSISVLYPCYSSYSLGYEEPSDGVQTHQVLILCYCSVF